MITGRALRSTETNNTTKYRNENEKKPTPKNDRWKDNHGCHSRAPAPPEFVDYTAPTPALDSTHINYGEPSEYPDIESSRTEVVSILIQPLEEAKRSSDNTLLQVSKVAKDVILKATDEARQVLTDSISAKVDGSADEAISKTNAAITAITQIIQTLEETLEAPQMDDLRNVKLIFPYRSGQAESTGQASSSRTGVALCCRACCCVQGCCCMCSKDYGIESYMLDFLYVIGIRSDCTRSHSGYVNTKKLFWVLLTVLVYILDNTKWSGCAYCDQYVTPEAAGCGGNCPKYADVGWAQLMGSDGVSSVVVEPDRTCEEHKRLGMLQTEHTVAATNWRKWAKTYRCPTSGLTKTEPGQICIFLVVMTILLAGLSTQHTERLIVQYWRKTHRWLKTSISVAFLCMHVFQFVMFLFFLAWHFIASLGTFVSVYWNVTLLITPFFVATFTMVSLGTLIQTEFLSAVKAINHESMSNVFAAYSNVQQVADHVSDALTYILPSVTIMFIVNLVLLLNVTDSQSMWLVIIGTSMLGFLGLMAYPNILIERGDLILRESLVTNRLVGHGDAKDQMNYRTASLFLDSDKSGIWVVGVLMTPDMLKLVATVFYTGMIYVYSTNSHSRCGEEREKILQVSVSSNTTRSIKMLYRMCDL